jgi:alanine racemase
MEQMDLDCYTSRLEIDLDTIGENLKKIRSYIHGLQVIPVVKSNAYGFGTVAIANYLIHECSVNFLAVARIFEACQILDSNCGQVDIMVLGPVPDYSIPLAVSRAIQVPLFRKETARLLSQEAKRQGKDRVKVQLKIETGMNRIGVKPGKELADLLDCVKQMGNIVIEGVFTHFATADEANAGRGNDFTREQFHLFCTALEQLRQAGIKPRYIHCCNTGATCWLKEAYPVCTHVRVGSLYLGYSSIQDDWNPVGVKEPASWKTIIVNVRNIMPGESVGYGRAFRPDKPSTVATIAVGYGDGYTRSFAVRGAPALVHGQRVHFVGTCMDMSFLDVTGIDCKIGDEVTLFGEDGQGNRISGLEIGHLMGETRLAMFSHITERVARVYQHKGASSPE